MTTEKKFIPALGYNWLTSFYDITIKVTMPEKKFRSKLIDYLQPENDEAILEFGFGTGQNLTLAFARNREAKYTGIDVDAKVKRIAELKLNKSNIPIRLDLYDGTKFPYSNNTFEKVFSSLVFHQLDRETKVACLREIHRVLKPGGKLIIGDWGKAKSRWMRLAFYFVQILDGFKTTTDNVDGLVPQFIREAGFKNVQEADFINTKIGSYCYYLAAK